MARGNVSLSLCLNELPFVTDNTTVKGVLSIEVRRHDIAIGNLTASLTYEERIDAVQNSGLVNSKELEGIPSTLPPGLHNFDFSFKTESLSGLYPSIHTSAKNESVGIYWTFSIHSSAMPELRASHIVPVYPTRALIIPEDGSDSSGHQNVQQQVPMITSLDSGPPHKERAKLFAMLFGPSYRSPKDGELCEVRVTLDIYIPEIGVFQSPNKSGFGFQVTTAAGNAVVLSMCFVKLISHTYVKGTRKSLTSTIDVWDRELEIILPRGCFDLTDELADIELPPCPGTTESQYLNQKYEIRFTFVLRALHFANLTRWVTLSAPVSVLPASMSLEDAPPPYLG